MNDHKFKEEFDKIDKWCDEVFSRPVPLEDREFYLKKREKYKKFVGEALNSNLGKRNLDITMDVIPLKSRLEKLPITPGERSDYDLYKRGEQVAKTIGRWGDHRTVSSYFLSVDEKKLVNLFLEKLNNHEFSTDTYRIQCYSLEHELANHEEETAKELDMVYGSMDYFMSLAVTIQQYGVGEDWKSRRSIIDLRLKYGCPIPYAEDREFVRNVLDLAASRWTEGDKP